MLKFNIKLILATAVLVLGGILAANAQISNGSVVRFEMPNSFVLRDTSFAAGEYTLERTPSMIDSPTLMILRGKGQSMVFDSALARVGKPSENTQLVFDLIGGTYYLTQIRTKGSDVATNIAGTSKRQLATRGPVTTVVLTMNNAF